LDLANTSWTRQKYCALTSMTVWIQGLTDTLTYLQKDAKKYVSAWTLSSARACTDDLHQTIAKLDDLSACIAEHVVAVEERVKQGRNQEMSDMRRRQCERTRLLAPWRAILVEARVPLHLLRYMLDKGILVQGHGDKAGLNAVPLYRHSECFAHVHASLVAVLWHRSTWMRLGTPAQCHRRQASRI
jgi:hypothetical protein